MADDLIYDVRPEVKVKTTKSANASYAIVWINGKLAGGWPNCYSSFRIDLTLYTAPFGSSAENFFASLDRHPYVAGGSVWSGCDYLGGAFPLLPCQKIIFWNY